MSTPEEAALSTEVPEVPEAPDAVSCSENATRPIFLFVLPLLWCSPNLSFVVRFPNNPLQAAKKRSPSDFLKAVLGRPVNVKLNSGTDYKGVLACLDGYMNIAMEQTEEYVDGQLKAKYGDCFIRGNNGRLTRVPNDGIVSFCVSRARCLAVNLSPYFAVLCSLIPCHLFLPFQ